jgi:uncharacterized membrane protein YdjX (TVP38/TMEM64 family)
MTLSPETIKQIPVGRILIGVMVIIALLALGRQIGDYLPQFVEWVDGIGWWGPLIFIGGYIVATIAFVPGSVLSFAAGATFGFINGLVYVFTAATIGATVAFLISRYIARQLIEERIQDNKNFAAIDRAIGRKGFKIVVLLRLSPIFPFNVLNYVLGLSNVSLSDYVLASVGMLPGTLLYVYFGKVTGDIVMLGGGDLMLNPSYYAFLVLGLIATIMVALLVTRASRQALQEIASNHMEVAPPPCDS